MYSVKLGEREHTVWGDFLRDQTSFDVTSLLKAIDYNHEPTQIVFLTNPGGGVRALLCHNLNSFYLHLLLYF